MSNGLRHLLAKMGVAALLVWGITFARKAPAQPTFTQVSASWKSSAPTQMHLSWLGSASGSQDITLDTESKAWLQDSPVLNVGAPQATFYRATASFQSTDTLVQRHYNPINPAGALSGNISLWQPGLPNIPKSIPEQTELLLAGVGSLIDCEITNTGTGPLLVAGGSFGSSGGVIQGTTTQQVSIPPHGTATYLVPVTSNLSTSLGFIQGYLNLSGTENGVGLLSTTQLVLPLGKLNSHHEIITPNGTTGSFFDVFFDVQSPAGFRESVESKGQMNWQISSTGAMRLSILNTEYDATVYLPNNYQSMATLWTSAPSPFTPTNVTLNASTWPPGAGKWIFGIATASIMAGARVAGAQATKLLLAGASQLLGPEVGIPVTLVLYSPPMEAWWNWLMGASGFAGGAVLNKKIYDKIFG